MKNYSVVIAGIIGAAVLPVLGNWGFSDVCSNEILGIGVPYFLSLPGLVVAYLGRVKQGDVKLSGFKKR